MKNLIWGLIPLTVGFAIYLIQDSFVNTSIEYHEDYMSIITKKTYTPEYIFEGVEEVKLPNGETGQKAVKKLYEEKMEIYIKNINGVESPLSGFTKEDFSKFDVGDSISITSTTDAGKYATLFKYGKKYKALKKLQSNQEIKSEPKWRKNFKTKMMGKYNMSPLDAERAANDVDKLFTEQNETAWKLYSGSEYLVKSEFMKRMEE